MFDLGKQQVQFKCPACSHGNQVTLDQVSRQEVISCGSCGQSIALKDGGSSVSRTISDVNSSFKNLNDVFKKLR